VIGLREAASGVARIDLPINSRKDTRISAAPSAVTSQRVSHSVATGALVGSPPRAGAPQSQLVANLRPPAIDAPSNSDSAGQNPDQPGSKFASRSLSKAVESSDMAEYFRWWVVDQSTGERRLTDKRISREDAQRRFPGAVPDLRTREFREEELFADTLPPD